MSMYFLAGLQGSWGSKQSTVRHQGSRTLSSSSTSIAFEYTRAAQVSSSFTPAPELARYLRIPGV